MRLGLAQEALSRKAEVSRRVLSALESGSGKPVQTDTLDRLAEALGTRVAIVLGEAVPGRAEEMLKLKLRQEELRVRHLRIALALTLEPQRARAKLKRALDQVSLWERRKSCSPRYIERWRSALARPPREAARAMSSFGEWENAMFQNSPWSWAWS